jgi:hypothetical protein
MTTQKNQIKQQIIATLVVVFMFGMIGGTFNVDYAGAIGANTVLNLLVQAGSLSLEAPSQVNFTDVTLAGVASNTAANLVQVNMRDMRGTGASWTAIGSANAMTAGNGATISNAFLRLAPGDIYALDGASNTGVVAGADYSGNFGDGPVTLANTSSNNGLGNYVINGSILNLTVPSTTYSGTYQNTLTLTIS